MAGIGTRSSSHTHIPHRRQRALGIGWVSLLTAVFLPVVLFFISAGVWHVTCTNPPYPTSDSSRERLCAGGLDDLLTVVGPAIVLVSMIAATLTGAICGLIAATTSSAVTRRVSGAWLSGSAAIYGGVIVILSLNPMFPNLMLLDQLSYVVIRAAGTMTIWLLVSGLVLLVARAILTRRARR